MSHCVELKPCWLQFQAVRLAEELLHRLLRHQGLQCRAERGFSQKSGAEECKRILRSSRTCRPRLYDRLLLMLGFAILCSLGKGISL